MRSAGPRRSQIQGCKFKAGPQQAGPPRSLVETCSNVRSSIPTRYLGLVCLFCALKQLELLGASLFGICTILGRDGIGINELLRRIGTEPWRKDQDHAELQGKSSGQSTQSWGNVRGSHHCFKIIIASKRANSQRPPRFAVSTIWLR